MQRAAAGDTSFWSFVLQFDKATGHIPFQKVAIGLVLSSC